MNDHNGHDGWHAAYEAALAENDPAKLAAKVLEAENAIVARLQRISTSNDDSKELAAIEDAICHIRTIQTEKLGYPKIETESQIDL